MSQENDNTDRVARIRRLVDAGDVARLGTELYRLYASVDDGQLVRLLEDIPVAIRVLLLRHKTEELEEAAVHRPQHCRRLASFITLVAHNLSAAELADWREPLLDLAAGNMALWEGWRLTCLVKVEQAAGRALPDLVVATVRRTALTALDPGELVTLTAGIEEPVLNPGEPWAERVNADLEGAEPAWRALIAHALTATRSQPTGKWERIGFSLLNDVGPEQARKAIASWLALAGKPRTWPAASFNGTGSAHLELDPFNARAMQGLAALLALSPADPESAAVLGELVEAALIRLPGIGLRSPKLASAAVHALVRIGDDDAYAQLSRLAGTVTYRPTLKVINAALAARAA